jgi:apolipoprotein N-acyltransferase
MVVAEYVLHRFTPFGSWAAAAYTQVDNLPLLQVASLFGLAGVSFAVYFVAAAAEAFWANRAAGSRPLLAACATLALAVAFGTVRLAFAAPGDTAQVAAVGTDATLGGWPLPGAEELARIEAVLLERTGEAARAGAKLVAWNEVATAVPPEDEPAFQERIRAAARQHGIELVAAYVVPLSESPPRYENKYVWVRPGGEIDHVYRKRHPVPGEPASPGTAELRTVDTAVGRATGALCYDYDFPSLALEQARLGIDLAVVPSSDWRGIDPIHTQMASLRAIEGGFSLLRSTRFGLSAGFDQYGRARGWESSFDSQRRVLLVALPTRRIETLYSRIGDVLVALCAAFVTAATAGRLDAARRSRAAAPAEAPSPSTPS